MAWGEVGLEGEGCCETDDAGAGMRLLLVGCLLGVGGMAYPITTIVSFGGILVAWNCVCSRDR